MIERIEIQYFRSIYRVIIKNINDLSIITGRNDVGKSNILKALNLFFNNFINEEGDFSFSDNYNLQRLEEVRKDTVKGKQFIQIKVTFKRNDSSSKTLPERFTITKKWNRDSSIPTVIDNVEQQLRKEGKKYNDRAKSSVTRYLNRIKYIYVPAIKDERIFTMMLSRLQESVFEKELSSDKILINGMNDVALRVSNATKALSDEFYTVTSIKSCIETPTSIGQIYRALNIITKSGDNDIPLKSRGDGIRVRYLPSIINYLAVNSSEKYIWGFEEPENSLEFNMARRMAKDFYDVYRKNSQIFITTHSPAFIDLANEDCAHGYRCYISESSTSITSFEHEKDEEALAEELGYAYILQKQYEEYKKKREELENNKKRIIELQNELALIHQPVLLTEGKTDAMILKTAWEKLYDDQPCPVNILSCSITDENQETGGCSVLTDTLNTVRFDSDRLCIGLFDNDEAGQKAYSKLNAQYIEDTKTGGKKNKSGTGYAMLIPASNESLKQISDHGFLSIEFLFPKEDILKDDNDVKLEIRQIPVVTKLGNIQISTEVNEEYWYAGKIDDRSKSAFAKSVVPTLNKESFINFIPLFNMIKTIIDSYNENTDITSC